MKLKKEYLILVAVLVALILYLVLHRSNRTFYQLPELSALSGKQISKLEITKSGNAIVLNKKDDVWHIEPYGYLADSGKVENMIHVIEQLELTALVSESKNYIRYDLTNEKNIHVKAWLGKTLSREFDIGKAAPTFKHTFVKLADDPNVYHASGDFRRKFDRTVDDLRDKSVLSFAQNTIREIKLTHEKNTIALNQKETVETPPEKKDPADNTTESSKTEIVWKDSKDKIVDASTVDSLLSFLNQLECEKYMNDVKKENLNNPTYSIVLKGEKEYSLLIFSKKDENAKNYPAISSQNDNPFFLSDTQVDSIKSKFDNFLKLK
jgi:hypothetical protein